MVAVIVVPLTDHARPLVVPRPPSVLLDVPVAPLTPLIAMVMCVPSFETTNVPLCAVVVSAGV